MPATLHDKVLIEDRDVHEKGVAGGHCDRVADCPAAGCIEPQVGPDSRHGGDRAGLPADGTHPSFLYGRVRTVNGSTYEGRLRWGRDQEAFWGDYFNGVRKENPWVAQVAPGRLPRRREPVTVFGIEIAHRERPIEPGRLFLMRFGDLARVEARGIDVLVTLKSGTTLVLARSEASDFDDGVRIWDPDRGVVDLDSLRMHSIEFFDSPAQHAAAPDRLFGKVHAKAGDSQGSFSGIKTSASAPMNSSLAM